MIKIEEKIGTALQLVDEVAEYIYEQKPPIDGIKDKQRALGSLSEICGLLESFIENLEL